MRPVLKRRSLSRVFSMERHEDTLEVLGLVNILRRCLTDGVSLLFCFSPAEQYERRTAAARTRLQLRRYVAAKRSQVERLDRV